MAGVALLLSTAARLIGHGFGIQSLEAMNSYARTGRSRSCLPRSPSARETSRASTRTVSISPSPIGRAS
jgi:hypothetical protein